MTLLLQHIDKGGTECLGGEEEHCDVSQLNSGYSARVNLRIVLLLEEFS